jgi:hypothetical protein
LYFWLRGECEEHKNVRFNTGAAEEECPSQNSLRASRERREEQPYTEFADQPSDSSSVRTRDRGRPTTLK